MSTPPISSNYDPKVYDPNAVSQQTHVDNNGVASAGSSAVLQPGAVDGTDHGASSQAAGLPLSGQPDLPDVDGAAHASAKTDAAAATIVAWLQEKPFYLSSCFDALAESLRNNAISAGNIRRIASQNQFAATSESASQQQAEVDGERESAKIQAAGAVIAASVSAGTAYLGARGNILGRIGPATEKGQAPNQKSMIAGAALSASGMAMGQVVTQMFALSDKFAGGGHKADEAKIAKAQLEILVAAYKAQDDEFNSQQQNAMQALGNVLSDLRKELYGIINDTNRSIAQNS